MAENIMKITNLSSSYGNIKALKGIDIEINKGEIVSLLGACAFRILWVVTVFRARTTMGCLLLSYPVSWGLTFVVLAGFFLVLWRRVLTQFTPQERAAD